MAVSKSKIPAELIFFDEILYLFFRIEISEFDKENREINVGVGYCWAQKNAAYIVMINGENIPNKQIILDKKLALFKDNIKNIVAKK